MPSIDLEKALEYRNIQEHLQYGNLTEYYLYKGIFFYVSLYPERHYKNKNMK